MPFDVRSRVAGSFESGTQRQTTGYTSIVKGPTSYEGVYSFRTGKGVSNSAPSPDDSYVPPKNGNIAEVLAYRKKFIERELTMLQTNGRTTPSHFLLGDVGHEFAVTKTTASVTPSTLVQHDNARGLTTLTNPHPRFVYTMNRVGTAVLTDVLTDFDGYFASKGLRYSSQGSAFGLFESEHLAQASNMINHMNPYKSKATIGQTLAELVRGDLPGLGIRLIKHFNLIKEMKAAGIKDAAHAVGSDYLNNVFGWTPILQDINAALAIFADIEKALFVSDDTRRARQWEVRSTSATINDSVGLVSAGLLQSAQQEDLFGTYTNSTSAGIAVQVSSAIPAHFLASERITIKTTARFHTGVRPSAANNGFWDRSLDLQKALGMTFSPDVIWELVPWSWLIDWFANIGSVLENVSTLGLTNTLLNYAYSTVRREAGVIVSVDPYRSTAVNQVQSFSGCTYVTRTDQKIRRVASPFGFGASLNSLSASQMAILVALGLARAR